MFREIPRAEVSQSFISKLYRSISKGLPHAEPVPTFRTNELELVQGVLQMLQGFPSSIFYWDDNRHIFCVKDGIYVSHLSQTSLSGTLNQFVFGGTCLKLVELFVKKVEVSHLRAPTLKAFTNSVYSWLKRLRDVALEEEVKSAGSDSGMTMTLLGLTNSLSSLCSGAEHLLQVVYGAIPSAFFDSESSIPAGEMAVHILDHLFKKLNDVCLVQGGEEEPYHLLLAIFVGTLLPYLEGLDSWLYDGTLNDPYEEMFFYANSAVSIDQSTFWERSYLLRPWRCRKSISGVFHVICSDGESTKLGKRETDDEEPLIVLSSARGRDQNDSDNVVCPFFLKEIARAIVSAGKSLQLVRHVRDEITKHSSQVGRCSRESEDGSPRCNCSEEESASYLYQISHAQVMEVLTLSEVFLVSFVGLIGDGNHIYEHFRTCSPEMAQICKSYMIKQKLEKGSQENVPTSMSSDKAWFKFLVETISEKGRQTDIGREVCSDSTIRDVGGSIEMPERKVAAKWRDSNYNNILGASVVCSFCPENPVITVCRDFLSKNMASWSELNISQNFHLPPLNDENLREAIFGVKNTNASMGVNQLNEEPFPRLNGTDYTFGFQFGELERLRLENDTKTVETLYPFPTLLPSFQEDLPMSELLPSQKNSTLASRILSWIHSFKPKNTLLPAVIIQECLAVYIKKQVDDIGKHVMLKLMSDWKLMDELGVLRGIYLLGSGDLLQQFLIVIFDKLDKGDCWDDDFELNTILQESIRNSADGALLSAPDSLVVSITKHNVSADEENTPGIVSTSHKVHSRCFGIDALDLLEFTYKVSWPLDLIANMDAIKKYNQVMGFLLKVKRAKYVLDKARKWMWKGRGGTSHNHKHHLLVEQKLLHFVDAFHQYVMDRVFHSAWIDLCSGMASAGSLDEVLEIHEAYLSSIQRQCFVAPDKLWALIASRIKNILGLALDFYSIQQTLSSGGAAPAIKARCEMEVDRIEKQFDDCIAFLLRILSFKLNVGHFPHLADLVTRINYNYFYMSDNGNLLTVPSFETTAKLGKTLPG